jgi:antitoxin component of MazEF toxin-antitoxin module
MVASKNRVKFERILTNGTGSLRVVIPLELAKALDYHAGETVEIWLEDDKIVMRRKD